jgi:serine palmitoyltransferase
MELDALQAQLGDLAQQASLAFQKVPGSAVLVRYIRSSYQNDPMRSAIELVLVLFFIRYLLSPSYSTHKQNYVKLREEVSLLTCLWRAMHGTDMDWLLVGN